ncbi:MAG TPA: nucleotidyltransferase domain-containing protein [Bacteroidales bacterium]|nr:nucleotidyltransferase domain-containing protein [Bacteroidales bacterium]HPM93035.1 nucleotidyltransferase domain-containing protein [Bacteroidales bacterium]
MDKDIADILEKYLNLVRYRFSGIETAILFGSYAKGKAGSYSDIDVALIFSDLKETERFDLQVQLMLIAAQIDSRIEPHPISSAEFKSENHFVHEIQRTGIEIKT